MEYFVTFAGYRRPGPGAKPEKTYDVQSVKGVQYEVRNVQFGTARLWEVATLIRRPDGGRAWRWAKDVSTGYAAAVVQACVTHDERVQQETAKALAQMSVVKAQPINAETFPHDNAFACFLACAIQTANRMALGQVAGAMFKPASRAFEERGLHDELRSIFIQTYVSAMEGMHPRGVPVDACQGNIAEENNPMAVRVIGVGLIA